MKNVVKLVIMLMAVLIIASCSDLLLDEEVDAAMPVITTQPANVDTNENLGYTLSVDARSADGGDLSYEWFMSRYADMSDAVLVGTHPDITVNNPESGVYYYFCRITNRNEGWNVSGKTTAVVSSEKVRVRVNNGFYPYTVEHYQQNLFDNDYTLIDTDNLVGEKNTNTLAVPRTYDGFTVQPVSQQKIVSDGSTVTKIYYDRNNYTISFETNGGSAVSSITARFGESITVPDNPSRTGYDFTQWNQSFPDTMPANDLILTASWQPKQYTITYVLNEGTNPESVPNKHTYGTTTVLPEPTNYPYIFDGWCTDSKCEGIVFNQLEKTAIEDDTTLYARWTTFKLVGSSEQKQGDIAKTGITINGRLLEKTSEVVVIPQGMQAVMYFENDSGGMFSEGRRIKLSSFAIGQFEVTRELYETVMGNNPSVLSTDGVAALNPVNNVDWLNAIMFCNELSKIKGLDPVYSCLVDDVYENDIVKWYEGLGKNRGKASLYIIMDLTKNGYRLPTETEWEFAARGGNPLLADWMYAYSGIDKLSETNTEDTDSTDSNLETVGWYKGNWGDISHEVGMKDSNRLGIYDLSGNVCEWCNDSYDKDITINDSLFIIDGFIENPYVYNAVNNRTLRGGAAHDRVKMCIVTKRVTGASPTLHDDGIGFRLVRTLTD